MNDYRFGNFLYTLRTEKGLSQSQLGEMLGVTNKSVSKWENGSAKPSTALIPQIAAIFDVTVEELFACKRFEKDGEYERIKGYLSIQKRRYATLTSLFLSLIAMIPPLFVAFICILNHFEWLDDDVIGPLGVVGLFCMLIVAITAFVIYQSNFSQARLPFAVTYSPRYIGFLKKGFLFSLLSYWGILLCFPPVYIMLLAYRENPFVGHVFLSLAVLVEIFLFGVSVYFANVKRLLRIQRTFGVEQLKRWFVFSELPLFGKVFYITVIVLFPFFFVFQILTLFQAELLIITFLTKALWCGGILPISLFPKRKGQEKHI